MSKPILPHTVTGYVPGAWDMFHVGHLNILQRARAHCDVLIVGVVTDEELFRAKGKMPIIPLDERIDVVRAMSIVDRVVIDHSTNKIEAWQAYGFDVLFKGDDWRGTAKGDRLEEHMASVGAEVHYFPYTAQTSSTKLRALISARS
jgi:glycerol-3-phosphate cytidylyltransferase